MIDNGFIPNISKNAVRLALKALKDVSWASLNGKIATPKSPFFHLNNPCGIKENPHEALYVKAIIFYYQPYNYNNIKNSRPLIIFQ
ncbi:hypothetical protein [Virgibacillus dokdonensis]|uniref:hypothetical protein n=1 Tax=Virgibacillus dokdonensis TaxID=302167 RepID=UPI00098BAEB0|nr:hypothetical protein [Virgibacillus dokdonensis]